MHILVVCLYLSMYRQSVTHVIGACCCSYLFVHLRKHFKTLSLLICKSCTTLWDPKLEFHPINFRCQSTKYWQTNYWFLLQTLWHRHLPSCNSPLTEQEEWQENCNSCSPVILKPDSSFDILSLGYIVYLLNI